MGLFAYIKNGVKYKMNQFPGAYPASRVSYNGSDVETALDELNADIIKIKSNTFSGTTTSLGQFGLYTGADRIPVSIRFTSIGGSQGGYIFSNVSGGNTYIVAQLVGGTTAGQTISGTYYYVEL